MRVLVTRPFEDARETAAALARRGHKAVIAPLLSLRFVDGPEPALRAIQAVLVTSANGIRGFARRTAKRDVPVFAVGSHTAVAASELGFSDVTNAQGDGTALARTVRERLKPEQGSLLLASTAYPRPVLWAALEQAGYCVSSLPVYEMDEQSVLPPAACEAFSARALDALLVFSPRSARVAAERIEEAGFAPNCRSLLACCISESAARPLEALPFREIRIAPEPNQESLLEKLDR